MNIGYGVLDHPIHKLRTWIPLEIEEFRKRGHHVVPIARGREQELRQEINNLDFIVCHFAKRAIQIKRLGVPFGVITHARGIWINNGDKLINVSKHPKCKWVGYVSSYHKDKFQEWGIKNKLLHTPICVDVDRFKRTNPIGDEIICGARHIPKKGLDIAIKSYPNITCFGEGMLTKQLKKISPTAKFTGYVSRNQLKEIYENAYLYIFPGIQTPDGDMDGQPGTVKEALCMGLQVIATPIAGTRDLKHVHFCEPTVESIQTLIDDVPKERNTKAEIYIRNKYSPKIFVDKILEEIE